jgi:hypothetical protein
VSSVEEQLNILTCLFQARWAGPSHLTCQQPGNCEDNTPNTSINKEGGTTFSILCAIEYLILTIEKMIIVHLRRHPL